MRISDWISDVCSSDLLALGTPLATAFVLLHGAGNGIMTIAKGTLPLVLFGPQGYGARQGVLMVPARVAQALAPWLFGICLDRWGAGALWVSAGLGIVGFMALLGLRAEKAEPSAAVTAAAPKAGGHGCRPSLGLGRTTSE